jgi:hypothetical protein
MLRYRDIIGLGRDDPVEEGLMRRTTRRSERRKRLDTREDAVMTSFAIPRKLHRDVAVAALELNWSFAEVTRAALQEWLAHHRSARGGSR